MNSQKLVFSGFPGHDVYNVTAPFEWKERSVIAGRVERRSEELSEIVLFSETDGEWRPIEGAPTFPGLQDPCVTMMDGKVILGGVRFPVTIGEDRKAWQMEFYREGLNGDLTRS